MYLTLLCDNPCVDLVVVCVDVAVILGGVIGGVVPVCVVVDGESDVPTG